jgi:hypothetical protein
VAERTVVKEQLTADMIDAGAELTARLDESGLPITTALWLFDPDLNEWRLLFASPDVATKGPLDVYTRIQKVVGQLGDKASAAPFSSIALMDADADLVRWLKKAIGTGPGVNRIRFSKNVIDGHFIDDALIYRAA